MTKIWDCCMFYNELDMLELRLNILGDVVDRFVICEAGETHSGKPKPAYFADNRARFARWADKIEYVYVPSLTALAGENSWHRERAHRNAIARGLERNASGDDWVIVADVDEIPAPQSVIQLHGLPLPAIVKFELDFYYYNFNHRVRQGWSVGAACWGYHQTPNSIRVSLGWEQPPAHTSGRKMFNPGGWHFSYFGGAQQVVNKVDAFMHHADPVIRDLPRDPYFIAQRMREGVDLYGRDLQIERVPLSDTLPAYVLANLDTYRHWIAQEAQA